tara:strand:- start:1452 stop:1667 length:216 start_codon:yes stop_codon:yes gene_type:complete
MTLVLDYPSKKELKACIGKPLAYTDPSADLFGIKDYSNATVCGSNRPHMTGHKREFFASITIKDGLISKVE